MLSWARINLEEFELINENTTYYTSSCLCNVVGEAEVILPTFSRGKSILLLNCPLDAQYNNSECCLARFILWGSVNTFSFSFIIKLL